MQYYFAPLEGITGFLYRTIHHKYYPGIHRYYAPFLVIGEGGVMKKRQLRDILPENNRDITVIPQLLTNHAEQFCKAAEQIYALGYQEINLNLGCPSGTVTGKGRGAGFLKWEYRGKLEAFLEEIFQNCSGDISIKTRIGWESPEEFEEICKLYHQFPVKELIIHPRTRKELYRPGVHHECFQQGYDRMECPLCYNGDITEMSKIKQLQQRYDKLNAVMIGRGLLANPGLLCEIQGATERKQRFVEFYQELFLGYQEELSGDTHLLHKMKELWIFMAPQFTNYEGYLKKIKKARKLTEYKEIVTALFTQEEMSVFSEN